MKTQFFLFTILLVGAVGLVSAQPANCPSPATNCEANWCWGEDPGKTKETYTIFADALKLKEYGRAIEPFEWLATTTPCLNEALYISGLKLYEAMAEEEKDANAKIKYQERVLALYDKRMAIYGEKLDVMERKALKFYPYELIERTNVVPDVAMVNKLYAYYEKLVEKGGASLKQNSIFVYYVDLMCKKKTLSKDISDDVILEKYGKITQIVDAKIAENVKKEAWEETKTAIDGLIENYVPMGCEYITNKLYPKLQANPQDLDMAKKIVSFILKIKDDADKSKCYKGEIFTKAVEVIYKSEKTASIARILAERAFADGNEELGIKYLNEAIELEADPAKKAEDIYRLAKMANKRGSLGEARSLALKMATTDPSRAGEAYSFIGDLYMSSYKACSSGDAVQSRAVFLAAYDMYAKAGDNKGMANAKAQFPSITDAFTLGRKEGESLTVGCWINTTTTLRLRPRQ
jgi:tetratricopeptide (TPR) repeat protein